MEEEKQEVEEQTFTQADIDKAVKERLGREKRKFEKKLDGVDLDAYREWEMKQEQAEIERKAERGEFESALKDMAQKKDAKIEALNSRLHDIQVDGAILTAASQFKAIAPQQVASLLKNQVVLNESGGVDVIEDGAVKYGEDGEAQTVNGLVKSFLESNPHFVQATPSGAGSGGNVGGSSLKPKSVSEMSMAEYREHRKTVGR